MTVGVRDTGLRIAACSSNRNCTSYEVIASAHTLHNVAAMQHVWMCVNEHITGCKGTSSIKVGGWRTE